MANQDLDAIRNAIAEKQGRRPRSRPRKGHGPAFRLGVTRSGRPQYGRILATAALTLAATIFAVTVGQLAQFWIGDHAASHGKPWGFFKALGFQQTDLPKNWGLIFAVLLEFRLLVWLILAAVLAAAVARPYQAVLIGLAAGLVPGTWPRHVPTITFPDWVGRILDKQHTWQQHSDPWRALAVLLLLALMATAWAERTQAV
jgi:putative Ca2+/H+ antiporter (TMEM165/GDT1 family)